MTVGLEFKGKAHWGRTSQGSVRLSDVFMGLGTVVTLNLPDLW